jgi:hypothetical protein
MALPLPRRSCGEDLDMQNSWMKVTFVASLGFGLIMLPGCGGGAPATQTKKADAEIGTARRSIETAKIQRSKSEYDLALSELNNARSAIKSGLSFAGGADKSTLKNLDEEVSKLSSQYEADKIQNPKPVVAKETTTVAQVDPEIAKKKAAEEKAKKDAEAAAKAKKDMDAKMSIADKPGDSKKNKMDDEPGPLPGDAKVAAGGEKKADGEAAEDPAKPKGIGPFPPADDNSPALNIVKVTSNGKYCFGYFQLYNKDENGQKIMGITIYFKDKDNALMIQPQSVITIPFKGFSEKAKDPTNGGNDAVTLGSHSIDGKTAMQFVAVGEHERAKDVKKMGVIVIYGDGSKISEVGPSGPAAAEAAVGEGKVNFK